MAAEYQPVELRHNHCEQQVIQKDLLPDELIAYPQWVCWRSIPRGEGRKPDKQPVNPRNLHNAGVHWKNTWSGFEIAHASYLKYRDNGIQGIGFVLTLDDPYVAVDIDQCIGDDSIDTHAVAIIETLKSYTEISPSGTGIRILVSCADYHENHRTEALEVYSHSRYVTITGNQVTGTSSTILPIPQEIIESLLLAKEAEQLPSQGRADRLATYDVGDLELWERIFRHDKYGTQHFRRFQGDTSLEQGDHSFTVIRLLNCLARWTNCDASRIRTLMLMSPLANEKWFERRGGGDWLDHQIADAIAYVSGKGGT